MPKASVAESVSYYSPYGSECGADAAAVPGVELSEDEEELAELYDYYSDEDA